MSTRALSVGGNVYACVGACISVYACDVSEDKVTVPARGGPPRSRPDRTHQANPTDSYRL